LNGERHDVVPDVHRLCRTPGVPLDANLPLELRAPALELPQQHHRGRLAAQIKGHSLSWLSRAGVSGLVGQSEWRRRRLLVVCYHGISLQDEHQWNPQLYVSRETLQRRFETLQRIGCEVLPLEEALERLAAGTLPRLAVVLTFDDGFYDFQARALPLLRQFDFPATVYLPTQRCEHNFPVVRLFVSYVLWKRRDTTLDGRDLPGLDGQYDLRTEAGRQRVMDELDAGMRRDRLGLAAKDAIVRRLVCQLDLDYEALFESRVLRLLTPAEVTTLAGEGVDFQLHTHRHQTPAEVDRFVQEIRDNRTRLEAMTGRTPRHFCYPSGVHRPGYPDLLRQEGILSATTCHPGLASQQSDPLLLPRFIDTEHVGDATFEAWVTGMAGWLPRRIGGDAPAQMP
jgi:peptidoglycan/xylan/chitin deacetylase (PgdA/CDA1 family)